MQRSLDNAFLSSVAISASDSNKNSKYYDGITDAYHFFCETESEVQIRRKWYLLQRWMGFYDNAKTFSDVPLLGAWVDSKYSYFNGFRDAFILKYSGCEPEWMEIET